MMRLWFWLSDPYFWPILYSEKIRNWYTFLIFSPYNIGLRKGVGAGARTGAASLVWFWHEK
jgi:hypothetical protein